MKRKVILVDGKRSILCLSFIPLFHRRMRERVFRMAESMVERDVTRSLKRRRRRSRIGLGIGIPKRVSFDPRFRFLLSVRTRTSFGCVESDESVRFFFVFLPSSWRSVRTKLLSPSFRTCFLSCIVPSLFFFSKD